MNSQDKILIVFGASSYAKSIASIARYNYTSIKFCVDDQYFDSTKNKMFGFDVISFSTAIEEYRSHDFIVGVGYKKMRARAEIFQRLKAEGLNIASVVSRNCYVGEALLGEGVVIFDGVVIEKDARVEDNVTIWSNATICHDSHVGAHTFIAAGSIIGGGSRVGRLSFLGFNSIILHHVKIGDECLIGAGTTLLSDLISYSKAVGQPARTVSKFSPDYGVMVK